MLKRILVIILYLVGNNLCSQNISVADSLKDGLNTIDNDSLKVTVLIKIARNEQPKQTLNFAHQALTLSEKLGIDELVAVSYEHIGLGHRKLGNNEKAIEFTLKALNIYEKLGQLYNISTLQLQIGAHFTNDKDFNRGVHYLKLALNSFKSENRSSKLAFTLINLGETYRLMRHLDSAEICFNQCIELNKELNSDLIQGYAVGNLGMVYSEMGCFEKANINLSEAIDLLKPLGDDYSVCIYKSDLAKNFIKEEQLLQGEQLLLESIEMANTGGVKEQIRDFSDDLAELYEEQGRYKKALAYRKQYELYHDSLVNIENVRKIEQIHSQYWIDKKEASIQLLEIENRRKRNHLLMLASGVLLLLSLSMVLFYIQRQRKRALQKVSQQKKIIEKREKEKALLLKELNHRVKNNLQMVASLINIQAGQCKEESITKALKTTQNRIDTLVLIHQKLYSEQEDMKVNLNNYINELANNLIYSANSNANLTLKATSVLVHVDVVISLGLILNELITNSLKYATTPNKELELNVTLSQENQQVILSVSDNGPGVPLEYEKGKRGSMGMKLVQSLVKQLKGEIQYQHCQGSCWTLTLNSENLN